MENAASASAILLTTEVAVAEEPKQEKEGGTGVAVCRAWDIKERLPVLPTGRQARGRCGMFNA